MNLRQGRGSKREHKSIKAPSTCNDAHVNGFKDLPFATAWALTPGGFNLNILGRGGLKCPWCQLLVHMAGLFCFCEFVEAGFFLVSLTICRCPPQVEVTWVSVFQGSWEGEEGPKFPTTRPPRSSGVINFLTSTGAIYSVCFDGSTGWSLVSCQGARVPLDTHRGRVLWTGPPPCQPSICLPQPTHMAMLLASMRGYDQEP